MVVVETVPPDCVSVIGELENAFASFLISNPVGGVMTISFVSDVPPTVKLCVPDVVPTPIYPKAPLNPDVTVIIVGPAAAVP